MGTARKVVLVSESGYWPRHDDLLLQLLKRPIGLFCAVGKDCEKFEDAVDWMWVENFPEATTTVITTSHPGESEAEVIEFATQFFGDFGDEVEIVRV